MTWMQDNMFGPPEPLGNLPKKVQMQDDAPVPAERELLWPWDLVKVLGPELLERLYGDIPRRTKLTVPETCRRLRCQKTHVYDMISDGVLDATDTRSPTALQPYYRIYRYSVVRWEFIREFVIEAHRCNLPPTDLDRCIEAADLIRKERRKRRLA